MFDLDASAGELALRAALVYGALLVMMRITGKRTVGQFTPFDLLVVMLLSEAAGPAMSGNDQSLPGGLLICAILIGLNALIGFVTSRSEAAEKFLDGEPVLLGRDGTFFERVRIRHRLSKDDIAQALREADCELQDMRCAFLENDGSISIQKKQPDAESSS